MTKVNTLAGMHVPRRRRFPFVLYRHRGLKSAEEKLLEFDSTGDAVDELFPNRPRND